MSKRLDENLGSVGYDGLIVANEPVADVFTVTIRKEATAAAAYKRGTVLALPAGDDKLVILGPTATTNETLTANCILAEDVEVGTTADVTVLAYRTGHFARNKLAVASGYTLKATDEEELRKSGILLSDAIEY
ncbi:head decoration protein [Flavonifractor plautii]|uniref:head decoration protein n=1 Tax=Flavonifractor plautii TaxID=292800 RepID=UPI002109EED7|nr:head decoration protein [Flavonifractor plautii]MCQ4785770.1 head decoration protein [Flavonifractor plautii]